MAEIELSILSRQCLDRRIPDQETLRKEVKAREDQRNNSNTTMEWLFKTEDARIKLKRLIRSCQNWIRRNKDKAEGLYYFVELI